MQEMDLCVYLCEFQNAVRFGKYSHLRAQNKDVQISVNGAKTVRWYLEHFPRCLSTGFGWTEPAGSPSLSTALLVLK